MLGSPENSSAWNDETHLAIAKAAGYYKWFNAAGADMIKIKAGKIEGSNHYVNNSRHAVITPPIIEAQMKRYNQQDRDGHLYGAIVHAVRDYVEMRKKEKYGEYHLAFCAHYIGDLSMPMHNVFYSAFNKKFHRKMEKWVNEEGLDSLVGNITIYPVKIDSEKDLIKEIARIANISIALGYRLESENRLITRPEAYQQLSHSASLFKAVLDYVNMISD